jgi:hypothetical protein
MNGSEKQIQWANEIKDKLITYNDTLQKIEFDENEQSYFEKLIKIEDASFWIREKGNIYLGQSWEWLYKLAIRRGFVNGKI